MKWPSLPGAGRSAVVIGAVMVALVGMYSSQLFWSSTEHADTIQPLRGRGTRDASMSSAPHAAALPGAATRHEAKAAKSEEIETASTPAKTPVHPEPELMAYLESSLAGVVDSDSLLDWILSYASLPVVPRIDLGYWDPELAAFPMRYDERGVKIFFCKELAPMVREDGARLTVCKLRIELQTNREVWMEGVLREGLRISVSISTDEAGEPVQFMAHLSPPVDLRGNWDRGINLKGMEYREGLIQSYRLDTKESRCLPLFVKNGLPTGTDPSRSCESFIPPNEEKVRLLSSRFQQLLKEVSQ